ncbi:cys/Met metabolism PLP-dependent enzyme family protein [Clostridium argentinense CDC 2741]|uniref:Aminotransferase n=1 Tax=Clostridium argentinense CDC 2741 TaxID=1418104 RepID=A0A0C1UEE7_9CLOT|nr:pyridoxal phosphate-dependent aminotransferase [Clostridium argentinense]ARC83454.1 aspartate aminotransferase [Clostridium argentinense]KIE45770.1 cys/Met metabolism PLP-dependent enzyme family protein [Clostridium argentinense CDC 2741]NFF39100.1 pyridoxal phosphate-dependent aminotransferase [Clostridium argentinense]NFP49512.1 pyridoxal phosphate-dependent aminotransferase [Clostridium argentinense]NFP72215.1 pyridoxal phosphate-dependent aminotransferase [Clostridium argentinense]
MISNDMVKLGKRRSIIRDIFEYGKIRSKEIGAENVYDFSLGNPSIPAPNCVKETIIDLLENEDSILLHGYTSAQGDFNVRKTIADFINNKYDTKLCADNIYMTVGAAASLTISLKALAVPGDEFIVFTPFFPEYRTFIESAGGKLIAVPSNEDDFQIDITKFTKAITPKTKAVVFNSPNNPSGVVISKENVIALCKVLKEKSAEYGHPIYLISDEPYRELVYDDIEVPYLTKHYDNTLVCYSFSKSLSLPGERIGYIVVSNEMEDAEDVYAAVCGAGRALGYVCAPSLFQRVIAKCIGETSDIAIYKKNRDLLYNGLTELGFQCIKPDGAFYLFAKSMEPDANAFCEKAKKHELLLVPSDDFGCPGYVRISYCVKTEQIINSMPAFEKLAKEYK